MRKFQRMFPSRLPPAAAGETFAISAPCREFAKRRISATK
jgi:hypothetical protein